MLLLIAVTKLVETTGKSTFDGWAMGKDLQVRKLMITPIT